jgi:hypothetical protein
MIWLGWRWGGCVLMYCSSFRNFTFCFYWFLFYFRVLVYICVIGVFLYGVCFNVRIYFVFIPFLYLFIVYVMWLYFINFSLKVYVALKRDYHILFVYWFAVMLRQSTIENPLKKTCFSFSVQYTWKCINFTHLNHKPINIMYDLLKMKKNIINHRGHVITLKRK